MTLVWQRGKALESDFIFLLHEGHHCGDVKKKDSLVCETGWISYRRCPVLLRNPIYGPPSLTYKRHDTDMVQWERVGCLLHPHRNSSVCLQSIILFLYCGFICASPRPPLKGDRGWAVIQGSFFSFSCFIIVVVKFLCVPLWPFHCWLSLRLSLIFLIQNSLISSPYVLFLWFAFHKWVTQERVIYSKRNTNSKMEANYQSNRFFQLRCTLDFLGALSGSISAHLPWFLKFKNKTFSEVLHEEIRFLKSCVEVSLFS